MDIFIGFVMGVIVMLLFLVGVAIGLRGASSREKTDTLPPNSVYFPKSEAYKSAFKNEPARWTYKTTTTTYAPKTKLNKTPPKGTPGAPKNPLPEDDKLTKENV